jgi:hypothetical protein
LDVTSTAPGRCEAQTGTGKIGSHQHRLGEEPCIRGGFCRVSRRNRAVNSIAAAADQQNAAQAAGANPEGDWLSRIN